MKLYGYFRSSAAYRVRIALNIKGLTVEHVPVHLMRGGGRHHAPEFVTKNRRGFFLCSSLTTAPFSHNRWQSSSI